MNEHVNVITGQQGSLELVLLLEVDGLEGLVGTEGKVLRDVGREAAAGRGTAEGLSHAADVVGTCNMWTSARVMYRCACVCRAGASCGM